MKKVQPVVLSSISQKESPRPSIFEGVALEPSKLPMAGITPFALLAALCTVLKQLSVCALNFSRFRIIQ